MPWPFPCTLPNPPCMQFLRTVLLGSVAAGGIFAYALFSSGGSMPQQGALVTTPAKVGEGASVRGSGDRGAAGH